MDMWVIVGNSNNNIKVKNAKAKYNSILRLILVNPFHRKSKGKWMFVGLQTQASDGYV